MEACTGIGRPRILEGLSVFDKRCILFGSEGSAKIFSSQYCGDDIEPHLTQRTNLPTAILETVEPIILDARVVYPTQPCGCCCELREVPRSICGCFNGMDLALDTTGNQLLITLGQFSIIKLERDIQLLMPAFDICMPDKDCCSSVGGDGVEDPCQIFSRFDFPVDEFFPPRRDCFGDNLSCGCNTSVANTNGCGCNAPANNNCGCGSGRSGNNCK